MQVQNRARHRAEPVHRHPVLGDVQRPERAPERAAAHRQLPVWMARVREDVAVVPRHGMNLAQDRDPLTRQGHHMRPAGLRHRVAPIGLVEVDVVYRDNLDQSARERSPRDPRLPLTCERRRLRIPRRSFRKGASPAGRASWRCWRASASRIARAFEEVPTALLVVALRHGLGQQFPSASSAFRFLPVGVPDITTEGRESGWSKGSPLEPSRSGPR